MFVEVGAASVAALISFQPTQITKEYILGVLQTISQKKRKKAGHIFLTFAHFFTLFWKIFKIRIHERQSMKEKIFLVTN